MAELRPDILSIPGSDDDLGSEYGSFAKEMRELTQFVPGCRFHRSSQVGGIIQFQNTKVIGHDAWGEVFGVDTERGEQEVGERWWMNLLTRKNFEGLEDLLKKYNVYHTKNVEFLRACCDKSTSKLDALLSFNCPGEKLVFMTSPVQMWTGDAVAYLPEMSEEDLRLERAIIEETIASKEFNYEYKLFKSDTEAHIYVEDERNRIFREALGKADAVEFEDMGTGITYTYPHNISFENVHELQKTGGWLPGLIRVYNDGAAAARTCSTIPMPIPEKYYDEERGIRRFGGLGSCSNCYPRLKEELEERLKQETVRGIKEEKYSVFTGEPAGKIGYKLDESRIKIRFEKRRRILAYPAE